MKETNQPTKTGQHYIEPSSNVQSPMVYIHKEVEWEYKYINLDFQNEGAPGEEFLNHYGINSWELAGIFTHEGQLHLYFKRVKES